MPDKDVAALMAGYQRDMQALQGRIRQDRESGEAALRRLLPIAQGCTGQSERVARILLGLYNGHRFPLDLTNLRGLDYPILEDVLAVLRMDANARQEVHCYFERGGRVFEKLAEDWGFNQVQEAQHG
jgi:hypothetical protein